MFRSDSYKEMSDVRGRRSSSALQGEAAADDVRRDVETTEVVAAQLFPAQDLGFRQFLVELQGARGSNPVGQQQLVARLKRE